MALRPSWWRTPAWLARPFTVSVKRPTPLREVTTLIAVAAGLHHQRIFVAPRRLLDARARGRAADLLLGNEQEGDRQPGLLALAHQVAQRVVGDVAARLHVVDAGPEDAVAFAADLQVLLDHADGMHGIEMGQHQDALAVALAHLRRRLALQDVAEAVAAGNALELQPEVAELALDMVDDLVDRLAVVARALDRHPFDDAVEHLLGIDLRFVLADFGHRHVSQLTVGDRSRRESRVPIRDARTRSQDEAVSRYWDQTGSQVKYSGERFMSVK